MKKQIGDIWWEGDFRYKQCTKARKRLCIGDNNTCTRFRADGTNLCTGHKNGTVRTPNKDLKKGDKMILNGIRYVYNGIQKVRLCDEVLPNGQLCEQTRVNDGKCKTHALAWKCKFTGYPCSRIRTVGNYCKRHENNVQNPKTKSRGETIISEILASMGMMATVNEPINHNGKILYPDFLIHGMDIAIEFDGKQHFEVVKYWKGEAGLEERKENDLLKDQWARDNRIALLRLSYKDLDCVRDHIENFINILPGLDDDQKIVSTDFEGYSERGYITI